MSVRRIEDLQFQVVEGSVTGSIVEESAVENRLKLDQLEDENIGLKQTINELKFKVNIEYIGTSTTITTPCMPVYVAMVISIGYMYIYTAISVLSTYREHIPVFMMIDFHTCMPTCTVYVTMMISIPL